MFTIIFYLGKTDKGFNKTDKVFGIRFYFFTLHILRGDFIHDMAEVKRENEKLKSKISMIHAKAKEINDKFFGEEEHSCNSLSGT